MTAGNFTEVPDQSAFKHYLMKRLLQNTEKHLDAGKLYNDIKHVVIVNSKVTLIYFVIQETGDEGGGIEQPICYDLITRSYPTP